MIAEWVDISQSLLFVERNGKATVWKNVELNSISDIDTLLFTFTKSKPESALL